MSTDYFLVCVDCDEAVRIVDNKGNFGDKGTWQEFYYNHVLCSHLIDFVAEYDINYDIIRIIKSGKACS